MDHLSYTYSGDGNKLDAVNTTIPSAKPTVPHFSDGTSSSSGEYNYDGSANMTRDDNKGITSTTYNYMSLPTTINLGVGKSITFLYDATGTLLKKTVTDGSTVTTRDYVGGMEYNNGVLDFIATEEGRLVKVSNPPAGAPLYYYEYALRDHLGSVRVTFKESTLAGLPEITGVEHYYSFGMRMGDTTMNYEGSNKYRYNGKEYQSDLGLNWYYYGFRFHDPVLGRFSTQDPLSEYFPQQSTYVYADNNPATLIDYMGLGGEIVMPEVIVTAEGKHWWDNYTFGHSGGGSGSWGGPGGSFGGDGSSSGGGWGGGGGYGGGFSSGRGTFGNPCQGNEVTVTAEREGGQTNVDMVVDGGLQVVAGVGLMSGGITGISTGIGSTAGVYAFGIGFSLTGVGVGNMINGFTGHTGSAVNGGWIEKLGSLPKNWFDIGWEITFGHPKKLR